MNDDVDDERVWTRGWPAPAVSKLVDKWRGEAVAAVPPEYADRGLHSKYLRLDNAAAGKDECADELEDALAAATAEQPRAASGELPTASQAPSQGGIPPYTPAASGGALSAWLHLKLAAAQNLPYSDGDTCEECQEAIREELLPLLAAHDQKVREQVIEECYLAARGTDKLDKVAAYQHYWRGRAEAAADVRKLKREVSDGQQAKTQ